MCAHAHPVTGHWIEAQSAGLAPARTLLASHVNHPRQWRVPRGTAARGVPGGVVGERPSALVISRAAPSGWWQPPAPVDELTPARCSRSISWRARVPAPERAALGKCRQPEAARAALLRASVPPGTRKSLAVRAIPHSDSASGMSTPAPRPAPTACRVAMPQGSAPASDQGSQAASVSADQHRLRRRPGPAADAHRLADGRVARRVPGRCGPHGISPSRARSAGGPPSPVRASRPMRASVSTLCTSAGRPR